MAKTIDIGMSPRRVAIAKGLSRLRADTYALYLKTHAFHWNVEGPMFQTLHQMFMGLYTETWNAIRSDRRTDPVRFGHYAPGSYRECAERSVHQGRDRRSRGENDDPRAIEGDRGLRHSRRDAGARRSRR